MGFHILPPQNSPAELDAFDGVCRQLLGFDDSLSFERIDGFLTALVAGPRLPPEAEWLGALCGGAFERAFGDPDAHAAALQVLQRRLKVLLAQLKLDALFDDPDALRLNPLVMEWTDAERQRLVDDEGWTDEQASTAQTGAVWCLGFVDAVEHFNALWAPPADEELAGHIDLLFERVGVMVLPPGDPEWDAHLATHYPKPASGALAPDRDSLFTDALMAVQDLRMAWADAAPKGDPHRKEPTPGRNDPCSCGSGKKYKKCHGAAA